MLLSVRIATPVSVRLFSHRSARIFVPVQTWRARATIPTISMPKPSDFFPIRKPSVAAIQGAAIGGGLGLALAADFRVVSPQSKLSANFVKIGMHPGFAMTYTLPRLIGPQQASLLFYTGRRVNGEDAVGLGLADEIVPPEYLLASAMALAAEIAENAPLAVEATRATLRADLLASVRAHTSEEARLQMLLKKTDDFAEGVRAVSERRRGIWRRR